MIFCDTSALAKFYVLERESANLQKRFEAEDEICVSDLARTELIGVFHRRFREKKWTRREFTNSVRQFEHDDLGGLWTWLPLDKSITAAAAQSFKSLPETVFLRASDCLHLVTASRHHFTEICTYDAHQAAAAPNFGLTAFSV